MKNIQEKHHTLCLNTFYTLWRICKRELTEKNGNKLTQKKIPTTELENTWQTYNMQNLYNVGAFLTSLKQFFLLLAKYSIWRVPLFPFSQILYLASTQLPYIQKLSAGQLFVFKRSTFRKKQKSQS